MTVQFLKKVAASKSNKYLIGMVLSIILDINFFSLIPTNAHERIH